MKNQSKYDSLWFHVGVSVLAGAKISWMPRCYWTKKIDKMMILKPQSYFENNLRQTKWNYVCWQRNWYIKIHEESSQITVRLKKTKKKNRDRMWTFWPFDGLGSCWIRSPEMMNGWEVQPVPLDLALKCHNINIGFIPHVSERWSTSPMLMRL